MRRIAQGFNSLLLLATLTAAAWAQATEEFIPRRQSKPPGPPLSPQEALARMQVPEGFQVELVAAEPDVVNPVAMTIDARGRFWICESLEYPRREPGPGRDRVKVLEDTDGDGRADKVTIFAEGLNIPSGIAIGHGGVWVANAPDLLFLQDTDGDGKADRREVIVTGFGRTDTHELPNSLTWGPDGWLYGLNGVFNHCHVRYAENNPNYRPDHPGWKFNCAVFRVHPRTRQFELFAEGTSNPWGIALDDRGEMFLSACVIDHLWHITQTGYYHRQAGPYPPHTWKIESIVKHRHQAAAYCGIHYFDSDAYPAKYRNVLYMGNIHGGCINADRLQPAGATYFATPEPDFLTANDVWFMPVIQKTGPDGSLYVLDWYDRYHCYQDANRDPAGVDRLKGRLYRVRYGDTPRAVGLDLESESDQQLLARLAAGNDFLRWTAQRILTERIAAGRSQGETVETLRQIVLDEAKPLVTRHHALWTLGSAGPLPVELHLALLKAKEPSLRAWGVRLAAEVESVVVSGEGTAPRAVARRENNAAARGTVTLQLDPRVREAVAALAGDDDPAVMLQVAIASRRIAGIDAPAVLTKVLSRSGSDELLPRIVWRNLEPLLDQHAEQVLTAIEAQHPATTPALQRVTPFLVDRLLASERGAASLARLLAMYSKLGDTASAQRCLAAVAARVQSGEIRGERLQDFRTALDPVLVKLVADGATSPLYADAALLAATWGNEAGLAAAREIFRSDERPRELRLQALSALIAARDEQLLPTIAQMLKDRRQRILHGPLISSLGRLSHDGVADVVLQSLPSLAEDQQPLAVELLAQRVAWAEKLLQAIADGRLPAGVVNVNQARRIQALQNARLNELLAKHWGTIRNDRNPARERVVQEMRKFIRHNPGDPHRGLAVYNKLCGQCHKLHGQGYDVGPDITVNGRSSFEQLLSNVFDPSLVIGSAYQARNVITTDGRALTGLLAEEGPDYIVLKMQGGKLERLARDQIDEIEISRLSMMPEGVEKQLTPTELADLFALLTLDKPPSDPNATRLAGVYDVQPRETTNPAEFAAIVAEAAPGFTTAASGEGGVALLAEHQGRKAVVRTHPVSQSEPCRLTSKVEVPSEGNPRLRVLVSHHPRGDWQLVAHAGGVKLGERIVGPESAKDGWLTLEFDLSKLAGQTVEIVLENRADDWAWEFAYWGSVDIVTDPPATPAGSE